jgi:hypothetical protein
VLDFVRLDDVVFRDNLFQKLAQRRDVPLAIAQLVELPSSRMLPLDPKRLIKGAARGNDAQVPVEHNEGLADRVYDCLREECLTCFMRGGHRPR